MFGERVRETREEEKKIKKTKKRGLPTDMK